MSQESYQKGFSRNEGSNLKNYFSPLKQAEITAIKSIRRLLYS